MPSFAKTVEPQWFDEDSDWPLIVASFAQQYGIRLHQEDPTYVEYSQLVRGLGPDTPLGRIVAIRSERDPKIIKEFTLDQRRIRAEWLAKQAAEKGEDAQQDEVKSWQSAFKLAFGKPKKKGVK